MRGFSMLLLAMTPFAAGPIALGQAVRVRVELLDVRCIQDTETAMDSDLFYVVTALLGSPEGSAKSDVIGPVALNMGRTASFHADKRVIFDARLPIRGSIRGGMRAINKNTDAEWPNQIDLAKEATVAVAGTAPTEAVDERAGAILNSVAKIYGGLPGSNLDSPLGRIELNISADGDSEKIGEWKTFDNTIGANTFSYKVRYRITREKQDHLRPNNG
jgi:hypothetical protein